MSDSIAVVFQQHISGCAPRYFPELAGTDVSVTLTRVVERPTATLYFFAVEGGAVQHPLLVKMRHLLEHHGRGPTSNRPRMNVTDLDKRYWYEYRGLSSIYNYFTQLNDPRFGAIRMLDVMHKYRAVVMTESKNPDLRKLLARGTRFSRQVSSERLARIMEHSGAWLAAYHRMPDDDHVEVRHSTRDDFVHEVERYALFLSEHLDDMATFEHLVDLVRREVPQGLPENLPMGRGHGDYSWRNILVGPNDRVEVLDTLAHWVVPVYEDIGYFVARLRSNQPQVYTQGFAYKSAWTTQWKQAFLSGYFGSQPIPHRAVRLYELLSVLDQWSSLVDLLEYKKSSLGARARLQLTHRWFWKITTELTHELEQTAASEAR